MSVGLVYVTVPNGVEALEDVTQVDVVKGSLWLYDHVDKVVAVYPRDYWSGFWADEEPDDDA